MCPSPYRSQGSRKRSTNCSLPRADRMLSLWRMNLKTRRAQSSRAARKHDPGGTDAAHGLFDLGFLELDVLARDRVVLTEAQLLGLRARVLLGDIEEAGVSAADELDLDGCRLGHR